MGAGGRVTGADDHAKLEKELIYSNAQRVLTWDHVNEILYSGERNGTINQWNKNSEPQFKVLCLGNSNYYLNSKDIKKKKLLQSRREKNLKQMSQLKQLINRPLNKKELEEFIMPDKSKKDKPGDMGAICQSRNSGQTVASDARRRARALTPDLTSSILKITGAKEQLERRKDSQGLGLSIYSTNEWRKKTIMGARPVKKSKLLYQRGSGGYEKLNRIKADKGHVDAITVLLPLPKLQFLASAGLDSKIILWDTIKLTKKREYFGFHRKGVVSLQFNENLIVLISGGIDHNIFIWNPYIGRERVNSRLARVLSEGAHGQHLVHADPAEPAAPGVDGRGQLREGVGHPATEVRVHDITQEQGEFQELEVQCKWLIPRNSWA